jgi:hypothetical protein
MLKLHRRKDTTRSNCPRPALADAVAAFEHHANLASQLDDLMGPRR